MVELAAVAMKRLFETPFVLYPTETAQLTGDAKLPGPSSSVGGFSFDIFFTRLYIAATRSWLLVRIAVAACKLITSSPYLSYLFSPELVICDGSCMRCMASRLSDKNRD